jgi:predicted RNase H-like HicB family nuclease
MSGNVHATRCEFTAVIEKHGHWWIGWVEEVPGVNCQERTREELLDSLKITLHEALEMSARDAVCGQHPPSEE